MCRRPPPPESHQKSGRVLRTKTQLVLLQDSWTQPPGTPGSAHALRLLSSILQLLSIVLLSVGNLTPFYYPEQSLHCVCVPCTLSSLLSMQRSTDQTESNHLAAIFLRMPHPNYVNIHRARDCWRACICFVTESQTRASCFNMRICLSRQKRS